MNAQICEEFFLTLLYSLEITDSLCLMYPQSALTFPTQYDAPVPGKVCGEVMESLQGEAIRNQQEGEWVEGGGRGLLERRGVGEGGWRGEAWGR